MLKILRVVISLLVIIPALILIASYIANSLFNQSVASEVKELFNTNPQEEKKFVTKQDLEGLPPSVQKWLEHSKVVGKEKIRTVRLKQKGLMRTKPDGAWMPVEAEQYFTVDKPGFIWKAKVKMAPLVYLTGKDKYYEGKGKMQIKLLSLFPVVNAQGREIDQGTLVRYLGEIARFPTAALSDYISWEEIDAHSARATMSYKGVTASAVFTFNEQGDLIDFTAKRYMETNGQYVLEDWSGQTKEYREFNGIRISSKTDVIWKLKSGDFNWYKCEITDIDYNKPVIY